MSMYRLAFGMAGPIFAFREKETVANLNKFYFFLYENIMILSSIEKVPFSSSSIVYLLNV